MRRRRAAMTAAALLCAALGTGAGVADGSARPPHADAVAAIRTWHTAAEIPGINALNQAGQAGIGALSCPDTGDCGAGGSFASTFNGKARTFQAFVVNKVRSSWQKAEEVPGTAALNTGGGAGIGSLSCASAGNCTAGGHYTDGTGHDQAFVVDETGGTWGNAQKVPGTTALNRGFPGATVNSVSCASAGDCVAGGQYSDSAGHEQAFIASETGGTWGNAQKVPGTTALNAGGYALVSSVSCPSAGNCAAGGLYASGSTAGIPTVQAFVISETNGTWGKAQEVPGTAALNTGGYAQVNSVSCPSAGNCGIGGMYSDRTPATEAFVATETNGTWGDAAEVPGIAALNAGGLAQVNAVSCTAPGSCSAGGFYLDASFDNQAFVVNQANGTWGGAAEVPGISALSQGSPGSTVASLSCAAPGVCSAGGYYSDAANHRQAYVVNESRGIWRTAQEVPGTAALNAGGQAATQAVSCAVKALCSAAGMYTDAQPRAEVFAVGEAYG